MASINAVLSLGHCYQIPEIYGSAGGGGRGALKKIYVMHGNLNYEKTFGDKAYIDCHCGKLDEVYIPL